MEEEKIYTELIKAALKLAGDNFTQIISKVNNKRLEEKRLKKTKDEKDKQIDKSKITLNDSEKIHGQISVDGEWAAKNIQNHIKEIERWAHIIKFSDLDGKKTLGSIYIQLDTYLLPAKRHLSLIERSRVIELEKAALSGKEHCVILGQPGAGKTTSLKKICDLIIQEKTDTVYTFPILLRFRDIGEISTSTPILDHISKTIPFEFKFNDTRDSKFSVGVDEVKEEAIFSFLNYINLILVLDGFDELKDSNAKKVVLNELRKLSSKLTDSKIVLSCRTGEFNYDLEYSNTYEIAPLNERQIDLFVNKWLNDNSKAKDFIQKVKSSPFADTSIKPLSLAHLCAIYERIGNVPEQPKTVYRKVVNLLIEEWDEQRSVIRESAFSGFQADQKFEFLTHLAFYLTTQYQSTIFTVSEFESAYQSICEYHNLPRGKASEVVKELESHTGLFVESGYGKFEFVHKSVQEYLSADYLIKLPSLNSVRKHFETLGSELAIAVSISSNSSLYYIELILNYFLRLKLSNSFYSSFTSRIASENPSFKQDELVSVATLVLLSIWVNPESKNFDRTKNISVGNQMHSALAELSKSIGLKEQKVKISKYYTYNVDVQDNKFVELIRIREPENHKRLPSKIYLPVEFYAEFNS